MASRARFRGIVSAAFGLFLAPVAVANVFVGDLSFAVFFGAAAFLFISFGMYASSNPEDFGSGDEEVPDSWMRAARIGGGLLVFASAAIATLLVL